MDAAFLRLRKPFSLISLWPSQDENGKDPAKFNGDNKQEEELFCYRVPFYYTKSARLQPRQSVYSQKGDVEEPRTTLCQSANATSTQLNSDVSALLSSLSPFKTTALMTSSNSAYLPTPEQQANKDYAQALQISAHNSVGYWNNNRAWVSMLDTAMLFKRPVLYAENGPAASGKFVLRGEIGEGSYGSLFKAAYFDRHGAHSFDLAVKVAVIKAHNATENLVNGIPQRIIDEFFIQKKFRSIEGVVHAHHVAEAHCSLASLAWVTATLFGGEKSTFEPSKGDRMFIFCLPYYDSDLRTCLKFENFSLYYGKMPTDAPRGARAPPKEKEAYLWLTVQRFFRLYHVIGKMHETDHGHFDIKTLNILLRHSQDPASVDLCDFGMSKQFDQERQRSRVWNSRTQIWEDYRSLQFSDAWNCYAPESTRNGSDPEYGVPYYEVLENNRKDLCDDDFIAFDLWGLGYTLFEMMQTYFRSPAQRQNILMWSKVHASSGHESLRALIEGFSTTRILKDLVLSLLEEDNYVRLAESRNILRKYPTANSLWAQHNQELKATLPPTTNSAPLTTQLSAMHLHQAPMFAKQTGVSSSTSSPQSHKVNS